jgi:predicted  nucleic acid-binding Zn-ribbon protein
MEIFDIIQTLADLSNKGSEFNEEIGELNLKVSTLQNALMKLEKGRALDPLQIKHMRDLLSEAVTLMQNVSKQTNLWRNIRNMFPGSELSQIKEINTKIEKAIQLVNLSINTHAAYKKRNYREIESDSDSNCSS